MADGGEDVEDEARGSTTPNTKDAVKSLTTQVSFFVDPYALFHFILLLFPNFLGRETN